MLTGAKVANEVAVQPTTERGISNAVIIAAYFRTPALMALMKNRNIFGSNLAHNFDIHKLTQTDAFIISTIHLPDTK